MRRPSRTNMTPPFSATHASTGVIFMNAWPKPAGRPVTMITGTPASPRRSRAAYVCASMRSPVVIVPSTSENSARTGPRSSESGRVISGGLNIMPTGPDTRSGDQAQRDVLGRRAAHRALALAGEPVLEVRVVQANDPADLEHGQRIR